MDAIIKLKDHFDRALSKHVDLVDYIGNEWWQLTPAQAEVFGLEPEDMPPLVLAWVLYESVANVASHDFNGSPLCVDVRVALAYVEQGVIDPSQWLPFAGLLGIREKKAYAWFYKATFEIEWSWAAPPRLDDDMPMPRAAILPKPTHPPVSDLSSGIDDLVPF